MNINKDTMINYFEHLNNLKSKEDETIKTISTLDVSSAEKANMKRHALYETFTYSELADKELFAAFKEIPDNAGYIKYLAQVEIHVYTSADHALLKDLLQSKGFVSNDLDLVKAIDENKPAFKTVIGSDSLSGLKAIIQDIDTVCAQNNIAFNEKVSDNIELISGVHVRKDVTSVFTSMTNISSPIILGSSTDNIIKYTLKNGYNFENSISVGNEIVSYDIPEVKEQAKKNGFITNFLLKKMAKAENDIKEKVIQQKIDSLRNGCDEYNELITKLTDSVVNFDINAHVSPTVSTLRSAQIENKRAYSLFENIAQANKGYVERSIDNNPEQIETHKKIIQKHGFKP